MILKRFLSKLHVSPCETRNNQGLQPKVLGCNPNTPGATPKSAWACPFSILIPSPPAEKKGNPRGRTRYPRPKNT